MVNKIRYQKSALSFTVIFLSLILGFVIVTGALSFMMVGVNEYNAVIPAQQNKTFTDLQESQNELNSTIQGIRSSVEAIEVDAGELQTFWNSFKGLGAILKLPIALINVGYDSTTALFLGTDIVPMWVQGLILLVVIVLIALAIIAAMTGGNQNI